MSRKTYYVFLIDLLLLAIGLFAKIMGIKDVSDRMGLLGLYNAAFIMPFLLLWINRDALQRKKVSKSLLFIQIVLVIAIEYVISIASCLFFGYYIDGPTKQITIIMFVIDAIIIFFGVHLAKSQNK